MEESCLALPYTREILERAGDVPVQTVSGAVIPDLAAAPFAGALTAGKRQLLLCRNKGRFFKPCPGTREYSCCGYQILNIGMNCPMDCVYCILQAYLNNPWLSFFVNIDDLLAEMTVAFKREPDRMWRIGTGEFTDSMALDHITCLSSILVRFMSDKANAVLELKTKTAAIDNLKNLPHNGRTIVAWSLNSPRIVAREEMRTASLDERLAAAALCASWGYKLAFHFDPIIKHQGWENGYAETVNRLFDTVPRESIVWISMGCLRFLPALKNIAGERFPHSKFFYEEFIEGLDGKSRYFRKKRVALYRRLFDLLNRRAAVDTCIYLCMESEEIWREVFGFSPEERGGLSAMLDQAVSRNMLRDI